MSHLSRGTYVRASLRFLALAVYALLFLSACASEPQLPPQERVKTQGYVIVRVELNASMVGVLAPAITTMELAATNAKPSDNPVVLFKLDNSSYGGWVAAGTYRVSAAVSGFGAGSVGVDATSSLSGIVTVKAGQVTDLQTLVLQPVGGNESIFIPVAQSADVRSLISKFQPAVGAQLLSTGIAVQALQPVIPVKASEQGRASSGQGLIADMLVSMSDSASAMEKQLHWNDAKNSDDLLRMAKKATTRLNGGNFLDDGRALFGSSLGQVLIRDPSGRWGSLDTGSLDDVEDVVRNGDTLVASLSNGALLYSNDSGSRWALVALPQPLDRTVRIVPQDAQNYILVTEGGCWNDFHFGVYHLSNLAHPALNTLKMIPLDFNNIQMTMWQLSQVYGRVAVIGDRLFIAESEDHLDVYDLRGGTWSQQVMSGTVVKMSTNNKGENAATLGTGLIRSNFLSTDGGQHWQKLEAPHMTNAVEFLTPSYAMGLDFDMGAFSSTTQIITTHDGGTHWVYGPDMKEPCVDFVVLDKEKRIVCSTSSGKIISTLNGTNWTLERTAY